MLPLPPSSTLFPYTTLFRSERCPTQPSQVVIRSHPHADFELSQCRNGYSCIPFRGPAERPTLLGRDRKSTRLNSSHTVISYAVFCLKKKNKNKHNDN